MARASRLGIEALEVRLCPALTIQFDYRYDSEGFFSDAVRRGTLEQAGRDLGARLDNPLGAIAPGGGNSWNAMFFAPGSGAQTEVPDLTIPERTIVIFVGGRNLNGTEAGIGGTGGYRASGSGPWFNQISTRGQSGYSLWGGSISFDTDTAWYWGDAAGLAAGKIDFYTVATHELGHVLGFGTAPSFNTLIAGRSFAGPQSTGINGGVAPSLSADLSHWAPNTTHGGAPASMQPYVLTGQRYGFTSLDYAGLADIGWSVASFTPTVSLAAPTINTVNAPIVLSGTSDGLAQTVRYINGEVIPDKSAVRPFADFNGVVRSFTADVNGDKIVDTIYATGPGGPSRFTAYSGATGTPLFGLEAAFGSEFTGGLFLAAADLDRDGTDEIIVSPDRGGGGRISIYKFNGGVSRIGDFFGIDDVTFRGGARVATGDLNGDGVPDLIVGAGFGGGPRIALFDGTTLTQGKPRKLTGDFFAFPGDAANKLRNGVYVTAGDLNNDGRADLIFGAGPGGGPQVYVLDTAQILAGNLAFAQQNPLRNFFAFNVDSRGGVRVATQDVDGDGQLDLVAGNGSAGSMAWFKSFDGSKAALYDPATFQNTNDGLYVGACQCQHCLNAIREPLTLISESDDAIKIDDLLTSSAR